MEYTSYAYLFPPRPDQKVPAGALGHYERLGWQAQVKKNGTCTIIFVHGDTVIFKQRHDDPNTPGEGLDHKSWSPLQEHIDFFRESCKGEGWNVFVGELLHSKTQDIKHQLYLFDQIVKDGVHLIGTTFAERQKMLRERWPSQTGERDSLRVGTYVSLAKNYKAGFNKLFDGAVKRAAERNARQLNVEDEGLVLKDPNARLEACFKQTANNGWQCKVRVPHKNYSF